MTRPSAALNQLQKDRLRDRIIELYERSFGQVVNNINDESTGVFILRAPAGTLESEYDEKIIPNFDKKYKGFLSNYGESVENKKAIVVKIGSGHWSFFESNFSTNEYFYRHTSGEDSACGAYLLMGILADNPDLRKGILYEKVVSDTRLALKKRSGSDSDESFIRALQQQQHVPLPGHAPVTASLARLFASIALDNGLAQMTEEDRTDALLARQDLNESGYMLTVDEVILCLRGLGINNVLEVSPEKDNIVFTMGDYIADLTRNQETEITKLATYIGVGSVGIRTLLEEKEFNKSICDKYYEGRKARRSLLPKVTKPVTLPATSKVIHIGNKKTHEVSTTLPKPESKLTLPNPISSEPAPKPTSPNPISPNPISPNPISPNPISPNPISSEPAPKPIVTVTAPEVPKELEKYSVFLKKKEEKSVAVAANKMGANGANIKKILAEYKVVKDKDIHKIFFRYAGEDEFSDLPIEVESSNNLFRIDGDNKVVIDNETYRNALKAFYFDKKNQVPTPTVRAAIAMQAFYHNQKAAR
jgi:hypothetical protein